MTDTREPFGSLLRRHRRQRRLSQLELALRAQTSQRHVSFLETGRSRPGRDVVLRLGDGLGLGLRDRDGLLLSAGLAPAYGDPGLRAPGTAPFVAVLEHLLAGHLPLPAVLADVSGKALTANRALTVLTELVEEQLLRPPVDLARLALHPQGLAPHVLNLPEWSRHVLASVDQRAEDTGDAAAARLAHELRGYLAAALTVPQTGLVVPLRLRTRHGDLTLVTTRMTLATPPTATVAELILEAFLPADHESAAILAALEDRRSGTPAVTAIDPSWPSPGPSPTGTPSQDDTISGCVHSQRLAP